MKQNNVIFSERKLTYLSDFQIHAVICMALGSNDLDESLCLAADLAKQRLRNPTSGTPAKASVLISSKFPLTKLVTVAFSIPRKQRPAFLREFSLRWSCLHLHLQFLSLNIRFFPITSKLKRFSFEKEK